MPLSSHVLPARSDWPDRPIRRCLRRMPGRGRQFNLPSGRSDHTEW
jgi:hypothetical protein